MFFFYTIAGIILGFEVLVLPSLRAKLAQIVDKKDIGIISMSNSMFGLYGNGVIKNNVPTPAVAVFY